MWVNGQTEGGCLSSNSYTMAFCLWGFQNISPCLTFSYSWSKKKKKIKENIFKKEEKRQEGKMVGGNRWVCLVDTILWDKMDHAQNCALYKLYTHYINVCYRDYHCKAVQISKFMTIEIITC